MKYSCQNYTHCGFGTQPVPPRKQAKSKRQEHASDTRYVKYIPVGFSTSHNKLFGYLLWIVGFTGAHRFYYGKPLTGMLWFFTAGLLGIGWLIDLFLIPSMNREANRMYRPGSLDFGIAWVLLVLLGWLGVHRFYQGKLITGFLYLISGGLFGVGVVYDVFTLNRQLDELHYQEQASWNGRLAFHY
jgi:TM2 domain-containing membrane protein YozV